MNNTEKQVKLSFERSSFELLIQSNGMKLQLQTPSFPHLLISGSGWLWLLIKLKLILIPYIM
jgi:hypothetical protein